LAVSVLAAVYLNKTVDQLAALKSLFKDCVREVVREERDAPDERSAARDRNAPRDCMDIHQLAEYLQCSEQSIRNWQNRSDNPLPHGYIGADPRYYLAEVQQWTRENAARRRKNKSDQGDEKAVTNPVAARKMRPTLMVADQRKGGKRVHVQTLERAHH
jgi:hypothetical protein